jgi:hypothetical protein
VAWYRQWAKEHTLLPGAPPEPAALAALLQPAPAERPAHEQSLVEPFRVAGEDAARGWRRGPGHLAWQLPVEQHDFAGSYSSLKRFLQRLDPGEPRATTLRLEVDPGTEAQVNFGFAGQLLIPSTIGAGGRGCS